MSGLATPSQRVPMTPESAAKLTDAKIEDTLHFLRTILMNEQQYLFCEYYSMGGTATKAAKAAGYASTGGLLNNSAIQDCTVLMREQLSRLANVTRDWRKLKLRDIVDRAMAQDPPMLSAATGAIRALNDMDMDEKVALTLEHGLNMMLAKLNVNPEQDLGLLGKLFHTINLSEEDFSVIDDQPDFTRTGPA